MSINQVNMKYNQEFYDVKKEYIYPDAFLQLHHKLPDLDTKIHHIYDNPETQQTLSLIATKQ